MARNRREAHLLQEGAERLRLRGPLLDELDAVEAMGLEGSGMLSLIVIAAPLENCCCAVSKGGELAKALSYPDEYVNS
jgi:hypothetical protein